MAIAPIASHPMSYQRYTLEARLEGLKLENPALASLGIDFGLRISLVLPRPNVADREVIRVLKNPSGEGNISLKKESLVERLIFKQTVNGPTGFRIQLSPITDPSVMERVLTTALRAGLTATGIWIGSEQPVALRGVARDPLRFLGDFSTESGLPEILATGLIDFDPDQKGSGKNVHSLTIPLIAVADWSRPVARRTRQRGGGRPTAKPLLKRDETIAKLKLKVKLIS